METNRYSDDDLSPEEKALSEFLRKRAAAMGCECRPEVDLDPTTKVVVLSHNPMCPAWKHPAATTHQN